MSKNRYYFRHITHRIYIQYNRHKYLCIYCSFSALLPSVVFDVCTHGISHAWRAHTTNGNERTFGGSSLRLHSARSSLFFFIFYPPSSFGMRQRSSLMALVLIAKHICQKSSVNKNEKKSALLQNLATRILHIWKSSYETSGRMLLLMLMLRMPPSPSPQPLPQETMASNEK